MARIKRISVIVDPSTERTANICYFKCPACEVEHSFMEDSNFNKDINLPTLYNAYLIQGQRLDASQNIETYLCHSFVIDGSIRYLNDCTHQYKNLTFDLPRY